MATILRLVGIGIFGCIAVVFAIFFGFYFLLLFFGILGIFLLAWAFGIPITIKEGGVKTGYIRWFKFYKNQ